VFPVELQSSQDSLAVLAVGIVVPDWVRRARPRPTPWDALREQQGCNQVAPLPVRSFRIAGSPRSLDAMVPGTVVVTAITVVSPLPRSAFSL